MVKITFIDYLGVERKVDAQVGLSVMEVAIQNEVPGVVAECGGSCACATCHVYIDVPWSDKLDPKQDNEEDMLDFAFDVQKNSRLSCQITVTEDMEGLIVKTPRKQG